MTFWTLLAIQIAAILLGSSLARADRFDLDVPSRAYLFGIHEMTQSTDMCKSISGVDIVCDTQRSQVSDPIYVGVGVDLLNQRSWKFGVEADYDSGLNGSSSLIPQQEASRGFSIKGALFLYVL